MSTGRSRPGKSAAPRFAAAAESWVEAQRAQWKDSSLVKYRNTLNKHLLPRYADTPLTGIRRETLLELSGELLREGLSASSVNAVLSVLRGVLRHARRLGWPAEDPGPVSLRTNPKPLRVLSRGEQERLADYLLRRGDPASRGILLSLYTGLRIGELCALTWGDISFDDRCIRVRRSMQRLQTMQDGPKTEVRLAAPKSASSQREIPIPDWMAELLEKARKPDGCYVLTGSTDYMEPRTMENRFRAAAAACGIVGATFHTCRHTFATRCIELGFDVKTLSEILGHASVNITMNRYVHPSMDFKRESMSRLAALFPGNSEHT